MSQDFRHIITQYMNELVPFFEPEDGFEDLKTLNEMQITLTPEEELEDNKWTNSSNLDLESVNMQ